MQVSANGIGIEVDDQGLPGGEPVLLIMGLGMQLVGWPEELVQMLVSRGLRVVRFDNRDIGLSQHFDHLGMPNLAIAGIRYSLHLKVRSAYGISDMADDALGVMDALGLRSAHIVGASMGGMIAQHLAARFPERVRSLTLMMTTSGSRRLPQPSMRVRRVLLSRPDGRDPAAVVKHFEHVLGVIGSPAYPPEPERLRQRLQRMVARSWHPVGTARQVMAVVADGDRSHLFGRIQAPVRVIHGQDDPLIPVAAAHDLVAKLPGAQLDIVPGMGHDLPLQLLERFAQGISDNAARARR
jgi:pimeloyl-ACP methyl ester carboxylesterase